MTETKEQRIADLIKDAAEYATDPDAPSADQGATKPKLLIEPNDPHRTVAALRDILAERGDLFDRGAPVRLFKDRRSGAIMARAVTADRIVMLAHQLARPVAFKPSEHSKGKFVEFNAPLPRAIATTYLELHGEWQLRPLNGIASAPLLRPDGSIWAANGYDAATGLFLENVPTISGLVPAAPNQADAAAALALIRSIFATFCFADATTVQDANGVPMVDQARPPSCDESAFLVALLTAVCRPSLEFAPGFLFRAPQLSGAGAGKGLLVRSICRIAFGQDPHAVTGGSDLHELEKRISAELMASGPVLFLDNLNNVTFKSNLLASAITERPARVRVLGKSEMLPINATAFIVMTGNALVVSEDLTRRFVAIDLDARVEDPEARAFPTDITQTVKDRRIDLLVAALTIWRWGRQQTLPTGKPLGGFPQWCQWVRDPLLALGCPDPVVRMVDAKRHDGQRQATVEIFQLWQHWHSDRPVKASGLHAEIKAVLDPQQRGRQFVEKCVASLVGVRVAGFVLSRQRSMGKWSAATYALQSAGDCQGHSEHSGQEVRHPDHTDEPK